MSMAVHNPIYLAYLGHQLNSNLSLKTRSKLLDENRDKIEIICLQPPFLMCCKLKDLKQCWGSHQAFGKSVEWKLKFGQKLVLTTPNFKQKSHFSVAMTFSTAASVKSNVGGQSPSW